MNTEKNQIEPLSAHESDEMWANIISEIRNREERKRKRNKNFIKLSASIAVAAMLIICCFVLYKVYKVPEVFYAEKSDISITLEDNSKITLLKGGRLRVGKNFRLRTREVFLEGNAIFNVSKSKDCPFIVHGSSYETRVLGTVFKVTQKGKSFNVDLYEGKVQVNKIDTPNQIFVLHPEQTFSNMGSEKISAVVTTKMQKITRNKLTATLNFAEFNVKDIFKIIEQTYHVQVKYPQDKTDLNLTLVSKNATAEEILERIAIQLNLNIRKNNDKTFELED